MPDMLTLIIVTVLFWAAYYGAIRILFDMLQEGGAFEVFHITAFKAKLFSSGKQSHRLLENALGGCAKCTALWWSWVWFALFSFTCYKLSVAPPGVALKAIGAILFVSINFSVGYKSLNNGLR